MAFLAKSDLYLAILDNELDEITRADNAIVTEALNAAEGEALTYLFDSYNTDAIFATTGSNRNAMLVQVVRDIAIYRIVARSQAGIDLNDRQERYEAAVAWLKMVKKMETYPNLPVRAVTQQVHIRYGSQPKRTNRF
jgi:phage gp36-like protein